MTYKILKIEVVKDNIVTTVSFDFGTETKQEVISHFQPSSKDEILIGIKNRALSEQRAIQAAETNKNIISELELNKEVEV